jgi:hypothetical protein
LREPLLPTSNLFWERASDLNEQNLGIHQGDQIGRLFGFWATVFGAVFLSTDAAQNFRATFFHGKSSVCIIF